MFTAVAQHKTSEGSIAKLTEQERLLLTLVSTGMGNIQIAAALGISEILVRRRLTWLLDKLHVMSRQELIRYALQHGLTTSAH